MAWPFPGEYFSSFVLGLRRVFLSPADGCVEPALLEDVLGWEGREEAALGAQRGGLQVVDHFYQFYRFFSTTDNSAGRAPE